jgi:hypothetical protein
MYSIPASRPVAQHLARRLDVHAAERHRTAGRRRGFIGPRDDRVMGNEWDEIRELHGTLRAIGHYSQLLGSFTELREEAASRSDVNMAALWNWLARQVVEVRDDDGRVLQAAARDFSTPAMGEN